MYGQNSRQKRSRSVVRLNQGSCRIFKTALTRVTSFSPRAESNWRARAARGLRSRCPLAVRGCEVRSGPCVDSIGVAAPDLALSQRIYQPIRRKRTALQRSTGARCARASFRGRESNDPFAGEGRLSTSALPRAQRKQPRLRMTSASLGHGALRRTGTANTCSGTFAKHDPCPRGSATTSSARAQPQASTSLEEVGAAKQRRVEANLPPPATAPAAPGARRAGARASA